MPGHLDSMLIRALRDAHVCIHDYLDGLKRDTHGHAVRRRLALSCCTRLASRLATAHPDGAAELQKVAAVLRNVSVRRTLSSHDLASHRTVVEAGLGVIRRLFSELTEAASNAA